LDLAFGEGVLIFLVGVFLGVSDKSMNPNKGPLGWSSFIYFLPAETFPGCGFLFTTSSFCSFFWFLS
jgi:hypothetical protein